MRDGLFLNKELSSWLVSLFFSLAFLLTFITNVSHTSLFVATIYLLLSLFFACNRSCPVFVTLSSNHIFLAFLCFYIWSLFSLLWSVDLSLSSRTAMNFIVCLLAMMVGSMLSDNELSRIIKFFIVIGLGMIMISAYQVFVQGFARPVGLFYDWNENGSFMVVGLLLLSVLFVFARKYHTHLVGAGIALLVYAIGLSQSRGAMLSLAIALILFFLLLVRNLKYRHRFVFFLIWAALGFALENMTTLLAALGFQFDSMTPHSSVGRLIDTIQSGDVSSTRFSLWKSALEQYLQKPYLGYGVGALWGGFAISRFHLDPVPPHSPHNDYLQLLVELGPMGLFLFLLFVFLLFRSYKTIQYTELGENKSQNTIAVWLALVAIFVHIIFNFHFYSVSFLMVIGVFSGYLGRVAIAGTSREYANPSTSLHKLISIITPLVILLVLVLHATTLVSDSMMRHAQDADGFDQAMRYYHAACRVAPYRAEPHIRQGELILHHTDSEQLTENEKGVLLDSAMKEFQTAKSISKYNYSAYYNSAELMRRIPARYPHADITDNYEMSLQLRPNSINAYLSYSDYLRDSGMSRASWEVLESAWGRWYYRIDPELLTQYLAGLLVLRQQYATTEDVEAVRRLQTKLQHYMEGDVAEKGIWIR